jgi:thiamine-monophosphate kinase
LYGGEDFQLVLCLPAKSANELVERLNQDAAIIGIITDGSAVILRDTQSFTNQSPEKHPDRELTLDRGFQHFSNQSSEAES